MNKNIIDFGEYVRSIKNMSKDELLDLLSEPSNRPSPRLYSIYLGTNTLKYFKDGISNNTQRKISSVTKN